MDITVFKFTMQIFLSILFLLTAYWVFGRKNKKDHLLKHVLSSLTLGVVVFLIHAFSRGRDLEFYTFLVEIIVVPIAITVVYLIIVCIIKRINANKNKTLNKKKRSGNPKIRTE